MNRKESKGGRTVKGNADLCSTARSELLKERLPAQRDHPICNNLLHSDRHVKIDELYVWKKAK